MAMEQKPVGAEGLLLHGTVYEPAAAGLLAWRMTKEVFARRRRRAQTQPLAVECGRSQQYCSPEVCAPAGK